MNQVTIVTSPSCSYCHAAKNLFDQRDISYEEIDLIKDSEQAQQLLIESGQRTVPQIFIDQKPIGGFTELVQLLNNSGIDLNHLSSL